jgi:hypothetical protein
MPTPDTSCTHAGSPRWLTSAPSEMAERASMMGSITRRTRRGRSPTHVVSCRRGARASAGSQFRRSPPRSQVKSSQVKRHHRSESYTPITPRSPLRGFDLTLRDAAQPATGRLRGCGR